jgi:hypothetical protein
MLSASLCGDTGICERIDIWQSKIQTAHLLQNSGTEDAVVPWRGLQVPYELHQ